MLFNSKIKNKRKGEKTLPKKLPIKERREKNKLAIRRYNHSELGEETRKKWLMTEKGKESIAKANSNYYIKGGRAKWLKTKKGKAYTKRKESNAERERRAQANYDVSEFIKTNRKAKGLTRKELADKLMVTLSLVQRWEDGQTLPVYEKCLLMSELFEVKYRKTLAPLIEEARKRSEESLAK